MKIENPKITMLINPEYTDIEITDSDSNTTIAKVKLTPEQLSTILSRQGYVNCECSTGDLTRVGKKHENKYFEFEITYSKTKEDLSLACNEALFNKVCTNGCRTTIINLKIHSFPKMVKIMHELSLGDGFKVADNE